MRGEEPALDMALLAQVDEMRSRDVGPGAEADGWYAALDEVKALARVDAARHHNRALSQAALCAALVKENTALREQAESARFELSRGVLDLVVPRPETSLGEVVAESVEEVLNLKHQVRDLNDLDCCGGPLTSLEEL